MSRMYQPNMNRILWNISELIMDSLLAGFLFWKHEWAWMALELFSCALSIYLIVFELRNSYVLVESGHIEVGYNMEIINSHKERYKHKAKEIA